MAALADVAQLLQNLHAMREPPPPSPVAPFLLMLTAGVVLAAAGFVAWRLASRRRAGLERAATLALVATRGLAPAERVAAQARLLRRIVLLKKGESAARAQGGDWLATLDGTFATRFFTEGAGRAYAEALYRRDIGQSAVEVEALDRSLADIIHRMGPSKRASSTPAASELAPGARAEA